MRISFEDALRRQRRLVTVIAVAAGLVIALWCSLFVCEISSDLIAPESLTLPTLGIIGGIGLLAAAGLCVLCVFAVRTTGARELQRVSAAIRAQYLPTEVDGAKWLRILRARADSRQIALRVLPGAIFAIIGATQLARHDSVYATMLWVTYLLALLFALGGAVLANIQGRPAARQLLAELEARTSSVP